MKDLSILKYARVSTNYYKFFDQTTVNETLWSDEI